MKSYGESAGPRVFTDLRCFDFSLMRFLTDSSIVVAVSFSAGFSCLCSQSSTGNHRGARDTALDSEPTAVLS